MFHLKRTICPLLVLATLASAGAAQAATYYVATTGSNGNTCAQAQSTSTPKLTIAGGVGCLAAGDTLIVSAGTYAGQTIQTVPSGSAGAYTIVKGDPAGARPKITNVASDRGVYLEGSAKNYIEVRHFEFDGVFNVMKLDGTNGTTNYPHHINFIDNVVHDTVSVGILIGSGTAGPPADGGDHLIQGNEFYNIGIGTPGYAPGINNIYNPGNRTIVEKNTMHNSCAGIIIYTGSIPVYDDIIRNNVLYDMARPELDTWQQGSNCGPAIGPLQTGGRHKIYNNIIYRSKKMAIGMGNGTNDIQVYNNSIYNLLDNSAGVSLGASTNVVTRNNIAYLTGGVNGHTMSNNLTTNPLFVDAANANFHLQSGSAAIDAGMAVPEVTVDYAGIPRPQGAAYDIGAYEGVGPLDVAAPLAPTGLNVQ